MGHFLLLALGVCTPNEQHNSFPTIQRPFSFWGTADAQSESPAAVRSCDSLMD